MLEQSDATGWMGMFCLNLMRIALELAEGQSRYTKGLALKFFEHYIYIGAAMKHMGGRNYSLWDEEDGFFYDVLRYPDGRFEKFRVRSLVGIIPLYAVEELRDRRRSKPCTSSAPTSIGSSKNRQRLTARLLPPDQAERRGSLRADDSRSRRS